MIDQEANCTAILELDKSLGSALSRRRYFFLRVGEDENKKSALHATIGGGGGGVIKKGKIKFSQNTWWTSLRNSTEFQNFNSNSGHPSWEAHG